MKQTIKTQEAVNAYRVLSSAKYDQLADADKIKVWKIARTLQPIATEFDKTAKDAAEKFKPSTDDFDEKYEKFIGFQRMIGIPNLDAKELPMGPAEYNEFLTKVITPYNNLVEKALKEFNEKEISIEFEGLSEDAFGRLMASNEWTIGQLMNIGMLIVE